MIIRRAFEEDLPGVIRLLADDRLGATREVVAEPLPDAYRHAFAAMEAQGGNELLVAVDNQEVVGCLQLTVIHGVSRLGATRAQIEGVRVASAHRGSGIGGALVQHAIARATEEGCTLVQLTTDASRADANRFYERLGFEPTHVGLKLRLAPAEVEEAVGRTGSIGRRVASCRARSCFTAYRSAPWIWRFWANRVWGH